MYSVFFFKQKTAYEMRISDWSSDVCSSDLVVLFHVCFADSDLISLQISPCPKLPYCQHLQLVVHLRRLPPSYVALPRWLGLQFKRSEERRVGKECVSTCRSRWSP